MDLLGRRAVVTGGSRGLGLAIAKALASRGAAVTLMARNGALLCRLARSLPVISPQQLHSYVSTDLMQLGNDPDAEIAESMNGVSILINCAGQANHALLARASARSIADTIHLNLTVPILLSKLAVKQMLRIRKPKAPTPVIVNISSVLSLTDTTIPGTSVYAGSKAGLLGFTRSLANELRGKVRVNAVLPGLVRETDMGSLFTIDKVVQTCTVDDVADTVVELVENEDLNGLCVVSANGYSEDPIKINSS